MDNLIIAGGSVLSLLSYFNHESHQDIDIYQTCNDSKRFKQFIDDLSKYTEIIYFFNRDHIIDIYVSYKDGLFKLQYIIKNESYDNIIHNFNEHFCKIFIMDKEFYTFESYIDFIRYKYTIVDTSKHGNYTSLQDYFEKRMNKYLQRGFTFVFPDEIKITDKKIYLLENEWLNIFYTYFVGSDEYEYEQLILYSRSINSSLIETNKEKFEKELYYKLKYNDTKLSNEYITVYKKILNNYKDDRYHDIYFVNHGLGKDLFNSTY